MEHTVVQGKCMSIIISVLMADIIVVSTYKATIALQAVYVLEEEGGKPTNGGGTKQTARLCTKYCQTLF